MTNETATVPAPSREEFEALLNETLGDETQLEGTVVKGRVTAIEGDYAVIDVGLKTEGRVPLKEFAPPGQPAQIKVGDEVEVYVERVENALGEAVLSRDKARREEAWDRLEEYYRKQEPVEGVIFGRVKGGFTVDLGGAVAFLPGSQLDVRPMRDAGPLMEKPEKFLILKFDRARNNIVVSRRAVMEEEMAEQRAELLKTLKEGDVIEGIVKNVTEYGAFVDIGGIDGLLHVTDMSWGRVGHPEDVVKVGEKVTVKVVRINPETQRISLGLKQLQPDPWEGIAAKYPVGSKVKGVVTNVTDYGAFVELEPGVEGLIHVSEMSWVRKNVPPSKIVSTSQEVEAVVLDVDPRKRRISLGLKQTMENPWETLAEKYPPGSVVEGEVRNITEFGLFIGIEDGIDGMVHLSDLSWDEPGEEAIRKYKKGDVVKAQVLDIDVEKERISLGIKQLEGDPLSAIAGKKKGDVVTCVVSEVKDGGIEVTIGDKIRTFIPRKELAKDRADQRPERFAPGEKVDAMITGIDRAHHKVSVSIKALEIAEEKKAVAKFGSADSGASLGEILGATLQKVKAQAESRQKGKAESKSGAKAETGAEAKTGAKEQAAGEAEAAGLNEDAEAETDEKPAKKAGAKKATAKKTTKKTAKAEQAEEASDDAAAAEGEAAAAGEETKA
ncbi:MAG: 30S ribosomal protein S1 [Rhodothalassiaceae bacterium]|nr:MAG: 30S ribosomal protein S1 [Rhodothalassiaceae bacterium]